MTISEYLDQAAQLERDARALLADADPTERLDAIKGRLNAVKDARLAALQGELRTLPPDDRRTAGVAFNQLKQRIGEALDAFVERQRLAESSRERRPIDLTMPARESWHGGRHPVTLVVDEIVAIFRELGFSIALGPEAELAWYNFGALNFPPDHPAMEMHDTLYLGDDTLLRTHTSPVQVRTLQRTRRRRAC